MCSKFVGNNLTTFGENKILKKRKKSSFYRCTRILVFLFRFQFPQFQLFGCLPYIEEASLEGEHTPSFGWVNCATVLNVQLCSMCKLCKLGLMCNCETVGSANCAMQGSASKYWFCPTAGPVQARALGIQKYSGQHKSILVNANVFWSTQKYSGQHKSILVNTNVQMVGNDRI